MNARNVIATGARTVVVAGLGIALGGFAVAGAYAEVAEENLAPAEEQVQLEQYQQEEGADQQEGSDAEETPEVIEEVGEETPEAAEEPMPEPMLLSVEEEPVALAAETDSTTQAQTKVVHFDSDGGSAVADYVVPDYSNMISFDAMPAYTPTKDGYVFLGWCFDNGSAVTSISRDDINPEITLHAKWKENTPYTVTFVSGLDGVKVEPATITGDTLGYMLPTPVDNSMTFLGWYDKSGARFTSLNWKTMTGDTTLYGKWKASDASYTVTYVTGREGIEVDSITIAADDGWLSTPRLSDTYSDFVGWYNNASLTGASVSSLSWADMTGDVTLYAKWYGTNTLNLALNGGSGIPTSIELGNGFQDNYTEQPVKAGSVFSGWCYDSACTNPMVSGINSGGSAKAILGRNVTDGMTLYAAWDSQLITVHVYDKDQQVLDHTFRMAPLGAPIDFTMFNGDGMVLVGAGASLEEAVTKTDYMTITPEYLLGKSLSGFEAVLYVILDEAPAAAENTITVEAENVPDADAEEILNSAALLNDDIVSLDEATGMTGTALVVALEEASYKGGAPESLTFEVYPVAADGSTIPNEAIKGDVKFNLPVPSSVVAAGYDQATVEHEGDPDQVVPIQEKDGAYFVAVSASHYSQFKLYFGISNTAPEQGPSADKPNADKPVETPADKPVETPADKPAGETVVPVQPGQQAQQPAASAPQKAQIAKTGDETASVLPVALTGVASLFAGIAALFLRKRNA